MVTHHPIRGPAEVYTALWLGALLAATDELRARSRPRSPTSPGGTSGAYPRAKA